MIDVKPLSAETDEDPHSTMFAPDGDALFGRPPLFRRAGPFVFVSGTCADDCLDQDMREQTRSCITSISDTLESLGGGLENLVEVTSYLVRMEDFVDYNETYSKFFSVDGPARTTVAVERLAKPDALIEMRGVAYITENTKAKS